MTFFYQICDSAKITFADGRIVCEDDQHVAFRKLESKLRAQENRIEEFIEEFQQLLEDENFLKKILAPVQSSVSSNQRFQLHSFSQNDSFLKLLLRIEAIQSRFMTAILQTIIAKSSALDELGEEAKSIPISLFNHIRWCEVIYEPAVLLEEMLNAVPLLPLSFQIDVISTIPTVISDLSREDIVNSLVDLSQAYPGLTASIFDAISNLNLPPNSNSQRVAVDSAQNSLVSAQESELPVLIRFLMESIYDSNSAQLILSSLRNKMADFIQSSLHDLNLNQDEYDLLVSQNLMNVNRTSNGNSSLNFLSTIHMILSIMKTYFQSKAYVFASFVSCVNEQDAENPLSTNLAEFDLWLLFAVFGYSKLKPKILSLMLKKFILGQLSFTTLFNAFSNTASLLENSFGSIVSIIQSLISMPAMQNSLAVSQAQTSMNKGTSNTQKSNKLLVENIKFLSEVEFQYSQSLAILMLIAAYFSFANASFRQELIVNIINSVTSSQKHESYASLYVLLFIAETEARGHKMMKMEKNQRSRNGKRHLLLSEIKSTQSNKFLKDVKDELTDIVGARNMRANAVTLYDFNPFLKTLLTEVQSFDLFQVRLVFRVLFLILLPNFIYDIIRKNHSSSSSSSSSSASGARGNGTEPGLVEVNLHEIISDEIMIILRKFSNSNNFNVRKITIVGFVSALSVVGNLARLKFVETSDTNIDVQKEEKSYLTRISFLILNHLFKLVVDDIDCKEFMFDEISYSFRIDFMTHNDFLCNIYRIIEQECQMLIGTLNLDDCEEGEYQQVKKCFLRVLECNRIQRTFLGNKTSNLPIHNSSELMCQGVAQGNALAITSHFSQSVSDEIYIRVLSGVLKHEVLSSDRTMEVSQSDARYLQHESFHKNSAFSFAALVNLLCGLSMKIENNCENIEQLVLAKLEMPSTDLFHSLKGFNSTVQRIVSSSYRIAIDYIREILNNFTIACSQNSEKISILVQRFKEVIEFENRYFQLAQILPELFSCLKNTDAKKGGKSKPAKGKTANKNTKSKNKDKKSNKETVDADEGLVNDEIDVDEDIQDAETDDESIAGSDELLSQNYIGYAVEKIILRPFHAITGILLAKFISVMTTNDPGVFNKDNRVHINNNSKQVIEKMLNIIYGSVKYLQTRKVNNKTIFHSNKGGIIVLRSIQLSGGSNVLASGNNEVTCVHIKTDSISEVEYIKELTQNQAFYAMFQILELYNNLCIRNADITSSAPNQAVHSFMNLFGTNDSNDLHPYVFLILEVLESILDSKVISSSFVADVQVGIQYRMSGREQATATNEQNLLVQVLNQFNPEYESDQNNQPAIAKIEMVFYTFSQYLFQILQNTQEISAQNVKIAMKILMVVEKILQFMKTMEEMISTSLNSDNIDEEAAKFTSFSQCKNDISQRFSEVSLFLLTFNFQYSPKDLGVIVKSLFQHNGVHWRLEKIDKLVHELFMDFYYSNEDVEREDGDNQAGEDGVTKFNVQTFQSFTNSSMNTYFATILRTLNESLDEVISSYNQLNDKEKNNINEDILNIICDITLLFRDSILLTRFATFEKKNILVSCMKDGKHFIETFMKVVKIISHLFIQGNKDRKNNNNAANNRLKIVQILTYFQKGTRQLHFICTHSKVTSDKLLSKEVPNMKKLLEKFLFIIRNLVNKSELVHAFKVSNLKHRFINGSEIVNNNDNDNDDNFYGELELEKKVKKSKSSAAKKSSKSKTEESEDNPAENIVKKKRGRSNKGSHAEDNNAADAILESSDVGENKRKRKAKGDSVKNDAKSNSKRSKNVSKKRNDDRDGDDEEVIDVDNSDEEGIDLDNEDIGDVDTDDVDALDNSDTDDLMRILEEELEESSDKEIVIEDDDNEEESIGQDSDKEIYRSKSKHEKSKGNNGKSNRFVIDSETESDNNE